MYDYSIGGVLYHSAKGTEWKSHKYIDKIRKDGRWIYKYLLNRKKTRRTEDLKGKDALNEKKSIKSKIQKETKLANQKKALSTANAREEQKTISKNTLNNTKKQVLEEYRKAMEEYIENTKNAQSSLQAGNATKELADRVNLLKKTTGIDPAKTTENMAKEIVQKKNQRVNDLKADSGKNEKLGKDSNNAKVGNTTNNTKAENTSTSIKVDRPIGRQKNVTQKEERQVQTNEVKIKDGNSKISVVQYKVQENPPRTEKMPLVRIRKYSNYYDIGENLYGSNEDYPISEYPEAYNFRKEGVIGYIPIYDKSGDLVMYIEEDPNGVDAYKNKFGESYNPFYTKKK